MADTIAALNIALGLTGVSTVERGLARVETLLGGVGRGALGLASTIGGALLGGIEAGGAALGALGVVVGKTGTDFLSLQEQALTAFTTMLGSGSKAAAFFAQLKSFAATTPFELPGILNTSQHLLAFGFAAKDIIPDLTAIGNAVSATGGGQAALDRVVLALGQIKAKGKVQGDEMLQLTENNISAWQYLANYLHTDVPNAMKMVTKGQVSGDTGVAAILAGLAGDPKFKGMMDAQSRTFAGMMSNLHDYWQMFAGALTVPVFDRVLKPGLAWLTNWLSGPGLAFGTRLGQGIARGMDLAADAFREFRSVLGGGMGSGSLVSRIAVGFLLVKDTITNRVLPAIRLLWNTFFGGAALPQAQTVIMGIVGLVEKLGRWFQLGVDGAITFSQALRGLWNGTAGGNGFTETLGRIGNALREIGLAFQSGGITGAFATLWAGYIAPGLATAWASFQAWVTGTAVPNVTGWALGLATAFGSWVGTVWTTHMQPGLAGLWVAVNLWFTGTAVPAMRGWAQQLGAALGGFLQAAGDYIGPRLGGWFSALAAGLTVSAQAVNTAIDGVGRFIGTKIGEGIMAYATSPAPGEAFAAIMKGIGLAALNSATLMVRLGIAIGQGIGGAVATGLSQTFPSLMPWLRGIIGGIPGPIGDAIRGALGFRSDNPNETGQQFGPFIPEPGPAPGNGATRRDVGGVLAGGANVAGRLSNPVAGPISLTVNVTNNGVTYDEAGNLIAGAIYNALQPMLAGGGGTANRQ